MNKIILRFASIFISFAIIFVSQNSHSADWKEAEFYDSQNNSYKLSDYSGKTVILMLWATWCPHCKNQMPALSLFKKLYSHKNLEVISVSTDRMGQKIVEKYFDTYNINNLTPYYDLNSKLMKSLGAYAVPTIVIISNKGELLGSYSGLQHISVEYLEELINSE